MANKHHEIMLSSCNKEEWNEWRQKNPHEQPNLALSVLKDKNFDGFNFKGAGFYRTDFLETGGRSQFNSLIDIDLLCL